MHSLPNHRYLISTSFWGGRKWIPQQTSTWCRTRYVTHATQRRRPNLCDYLLTPPTQILISILSFLPSRSLLALATVSRRFSSAILRILRLRLVRTASLPDHRLILECYHPSAKLSTPYLYCDYLSTDGIGEAGAGEDSPGLTLAGLGSAYSHFRLVKQDENRRGRRRYPRRGVQGQQAQTQDVTGEAQGSSSSSSNPAPPSHELPDQPFEDVFMEQGEMFSQLCTVTNLVKVGPKPGLFLSHVNVGDGLIRLWRNWLAAQAADRTEAAGTTSATPILWADTAQTVGVRFRVEERDAMGWEMLPVLMAPDEEMPVAYRLEFDELVVRAGRLLLMVEASERQEVTTSGKAIVIASF